MRNKLVAAIAAGTLAVGLLAGAAGALLVHAGSPSTNAPYAQMQGGYGAGMMGSGSGYGRMGGSWDYTDMLNAMRDHMGFAGSSSR
jgi:hypothetical protein